MNAKLSMIAATAAVAVSLALTATLPAGAQSPNAASSGNTVSMREDPNASALFGPLVKAYYEFCVAELGKGANKVNVDAFEKKSFALFRSIAVSKGVNPDALQEHLKAIPRQIVQIVQRDPKTLDSLQTFTDALVGPDWDTACSRSPECSAQRDAAARQK